MKNEELYKMTELLDALEGILVSVIKNTLSKN